MVLYRAGNLARCDIVLLDTGNLGKVSRYRFKSKPLLGCLVRDPISL